MKSPLVEVPPAVRQVWGGSDVPPELPLIEYAMRCVERHHTLSRTFLDVGAHIGSWSVPMSRLARVRAFEPNENLIETLRRNLCEVGIPDPWVFSVALGSEPSVRTYAQVSQDGGGNTLCPERAALFKDAQFTCVPIVHGDAYASNLRHVAAIKIDVEGFEIPVLQGLQKTIVRNRPDIFVECWPQEWNIVKRTQMYSTLFRWNYTVVKLPEELQRQFPDMHHAVHSSSRAASALESRTLADTYV